MFCFSSANNNMTCVATLCVKNYATLTHILTVRTASEIVPVNNNLHIVH